MQTGLSCHTHCHIEIFARDKAREDKGGWVPRLSASLTPLFSPNDTLTCAELSIVSVSLPAVVVTPPPRGKEQAFPQACQQCLLCFPFQ